MKTLHLSIILFFALIIGVNAELINPNFENGTTNWYNATWEEGNTHPKEDTTSIKSGIKSLRFDLKGKNTVCTYQDISLPERAKKISGRGFIKAENFPNGYYTGIVVEFLDENGKWLSIANIGTLEVASGNFDFQEVSGAINIPEKAKTARVELKAKGNNLSESTPAWKLWFDNININLIDKDNNTIGEDSSNKEISSDKANNFLSNGDFEYDLFDWNNMDWEPTIAGDIVTKEKVSGAKSIEFIGEANKAVGTYTDIKKPANAKYIINYFNIKGENLPNDWSCGMKVEFLDKDYKWISIDNLGDLQGAGKSIDWQFIKANKVTIPENCEIMRIELRARKNNGSLDNVDNWKIYYDNIILELYDKDNNIIKPTSKPISMARKVDPTIKAGANILINSDITTANNWVNAVWTDPVLSSLYSDDSTKKSSYCLLFDGKNGKGAQIYQDIKAISNVNTYRLTGYIKGKNFAKDWNAYFAIEFLDKDNKWLAMASTPAITGNGTSFDWTKLDSDITIPENTATLRVELLVRKANESAPKEFGTILADEISLCPIYNKSETGKVVLGRVEPQNQRQGVFYITEPPVIVASIINENTKQKTVNLNFEIKDFWNKTIQKTTEKITIEPGEEKKHILTIKNPNKTGFFGVNVYLSENGTPCGNFTTSFIMEEKLASVDPFFGITAYGPGNPSTMRSIGCGSVGFHIGWGSIESEKGKMNFTETDKWLKQWTDLGIRPIGFTEFRPNEFQPMWALNEYIPKWQALSYNQPLPDDNSDYWKDYKNYIRELTQHYKDKIRTWSYYGELDITSPQGQDWYMKHYQVTGKVMKEVDPTCTIGGIGVSGYGMKTAREKWPLVKDIFDAQFFDPYIWPSKFGPGQNPPGDENGGYIEMLTDTLKHIREYSKNKIAVDEKGFSILSSLPVDDKYAKDMGNATARSLILTKTIPECNRYLYFMASYWDEGGYDYGLFKPEGPRPSAATYATVARLLKDTNNSKKINIHKNIYSYVFNKKTGGTICPLWTTLAGDISLSFNTVNPVTVYDLMGNPIIKDKTGNIRVSISASPIFIESKTKEDEVIKIFSKAKYSLPTVKADCKLENKDTLALYLYNQTNADVETKINIAPINGCTLSKTNFNEKIKANDLAKIEIPITNFTYSKSKKVIATLLTNNNEVKLEKDIILYKINKITNNTVDGDLSKYEKFTPVIMDNPSNIFPQGGDAVANKTWTGPEDLSLKVWQTWDEDYFYFAALVTDDSFYMVNTGENIWNGDGFQFMFDTKNDATNPNASGKTSLSEDDYQIGFALTPKGEETWCWYASTENKNMIGQKVDGAKTAIKKISDTQTAYEIGIPWSKLAPFTPKLGNAIGFNFDYVDYEKKGDEMKYWMGYSLGISSGKAPHFFPTFILE